MDRDQFLGVITVAVAKKSAKDLMLCSIRITGYWFAFL